MVSKVNKSLQYKMQLRKNLLQNYDRSNFKRAKAMFYITLF